MDDLHKLLSRIEPGVVVLDLGCGRGSFHYETCRGRIIALDLAVPDSPAPHPRALYVRGDSSCLPLAEQSVDVVVSHHTLEHFHDYRSTLTEIGRVLSPGGWLWIAVPNGYGFDDALYRYIFDGGGHVNRFEYQSLVREVETVTRTRLIGSCRLFSGFIYLKRPAEDELKHYPPRARFLRDIPAGFLTFLVLGLNTMTRLSDKVFGTSYSHYGWAFVFARQDMAIDAMMPCFNVCRRCGSGNAAASLGPSRIPFNRLLRVYSCPHCAEVNIAVSPRTGLR